MCMFIHLRIRLFMVKIECLFHKLIDFLLDYPVKPQIRPQLCCIPCNAMKNDFLHVNKFRAFPNMNYQDCLTHCFRGFKRFKKIQTTFRWHHCYIDQREGLGTFLRFEFSSLIKAFNLFYSFTSSDLPAEQTFD